MGGENTSFGSCNNIAINISRLAQGLRIQGELAVLFVDSETENSINKPDFSTN